MEIKRIILEIDKEIILRQYIPDDAPAIFKLIDENREYLNRNREDTAKKYPTLLSVLDSIINPPNPKRLRLGIWVGENFVGSVNMTPQDNCQAEIGYWLGELYEGKGYIIRSAWKLIQFTFKTSETNSILARVAETNTRSINVLKRLDFAELEANDNSLIFSLERWIPFWLDVNRFYGMVFSKKRWKEIILKKYNGNIARLKGMLSNSLYPRAELDFGEGAAYVSLPTLGKWAEENRINLEI